MTFYRVTNWKKFQHYHDRNPPWIKLHFELLSSVDWVMLDDTSRVLAIACMLIASRNGGNVPNNPSYLKRVAYLNKTPNFEPLLECGFLEHASEMVADASECKHMIADARPETETETETEGETETEKKRHNFLCFDKCWKMFRSYGVKKTALKYWKMLKPEDHADIEAKIPAYLQAVDAGRKQMQFEGWINPATRKWDVDWERAAKIEKATGKQPLINTYHETNDLNQPLNF